MTVKKNSLAKGKGSAEMTEKKTRKKSTKKRRPGPPGKKNGPAKGEGGAPQIEIEWKKFDALCAMHATAKEIAAVLGVCDDTLLSACRREHGKTLEEYIAERRMTGNASLRRRQWLIAESGNPTMLIWLGKQWLGQVDKLETKNEHHGANFQIYIPSNGRD